MEKVLHGIFIFKSSKDFQQWKKLTSQYVSKEMFNDRYIRNVKKIHWVS